MDTLSTLRTAVWDRLDSASDDPYHPVTHITKALNTALTRSADRLGATVGRGRYMKRLANLEADGGFNTTTLVWTLPATFRRPYLLIRDGVEIEPVPAEREFSTYGADGYLVVGRELWLTENTDATDLEVYYVYAPAAMSGDNDVPDWIEGYEEYLVARAAASRMKKGDLHDPRPLLEEAREMWPDIVLAAAAHPLPRTIRRRTRPFGEHWYG